MNKSPEPTIKDVLEKLDSVESNLSSSIEALARSTAKQFERVDGKFEITWKEMSRMNDDISDMKTTLHSFVPLVAQHDKDIGLLKDWVFDK